MMVRSFKGIHPRSDSSCYVDASAQIIGNVQLEPRQGEAGAEFRRTRLDSAIGRELRWVCKGLR